MSHLFCHSCGNKLEFANAKPNFCGKCGQQLAVTHATNTNTAVGQPVLKESVELKGGETDASSVPHIDKIQVEYVAEGHNTFTVGSLVGDNSPPDYKKRREPKSVDEFIDEKGQR